MVGGGIKTRKGSPAMSLPFFSFNCAINQEHGNVNCCIAYNNIYYKPPSAFFFFIIIESSES